MGVAALGMTELRAGSGLGRGRVQGEGQQAGADLMAAPRSAPPRPAQVKPLIWIESVIEKHSHSRIEYMIKVRPREVVAGAPAWCPHGVSPGLRRGRHRGRDGMGCPGLGGRQRAGGRGSPPHPGHPMEAARDPQAKSQFKRRSTANNVEIHIPVPNDADSPKFKTTVGSVKWVPENSEIVWSIKSFPVSSQRARAPTRA